jgi:hypothetical protein
MSDSARTTGRLGKLPSDIDADGLLTTELLADEFLPPWKVRT